MINIDNLQIELDNLTRIHNCKIIYMLNDIRLIILNEKLTIDFGYINMTIREYEAFEILQMGMYHEVIYALKYNKKFDLVEG